MPKLLMLKGLPASGKTKYARELVEEGWTRINKDEIRKMLHNSKWSKSNEDEVIRVRNAIMDVATYADKNIVIDDTNFAPKHEEFFRTFADVNDYSFEVNFIDTPLEECIARNEKRADKVPIEVIYDMHAKYLAPEKKEAAYEEELDEAIIVDVDGTLAHIDSANPRNVYDASLAHMDILDEAVAGIVNMHYQHGYRVIILTGRHSGHLEVTEKWLKDKGVPYDAIFCRQEGDKRKDYDVKQELYESHIKGKYNVRFVIDDRPSVCRMWRSNGLKVMQVGDPHVEF